MSYRVIKTVKGRQYIYEQTSQRQGKRVITKSRYIGPLVPAHRTGRTPKVITTRLSRSDVAKAVSSQSFRNFIAKGEGGFYPVGLLPTTIKSIWPKLQRREVLISASTKRKIGYKHPEVTLEDYASIQTIIEEGEVYLDERNHLEIYYRNEQQLWRFVLKTTSKGEVLLTTFHRVSERRLRKAERALTRKAL